MNWLNCDLDVMCGLYRQDLDGQWAGHVTAYHITKSENIPSILANGLTARSCQATQRGESRGPAVYLLAHKGDAYDSQVRDFLFDNTDNLAVVKVTIPRSAYDKLHYDGLFNVSCMCSDGSFPTGVQYTGNIPADWIQEAR